MANWTSDFFEPAFVKDPNVRDALEVIFDMLMDLRKQFNGNVDSQNLATGAVGSAELADLSVTTQKLADSAVITDKMANAAVSTQKLADLAVEAAKLATASVTTVKVADAAVTDAKMAKWLIGKVGTTFPTVPDDGELFYRTDVNHAYRYASSLSLNALDFDGVNDKVDLGAVGNPSVVTIEAWILPDTLGDLRRVVTKYIGSGEPTGSIVFDVVNANGDLRLAIVGPAGIESVTATNAVTAGTLQHVAGVFDGSTLRVYHNGTLANSAAASFATIPSLTENWTIASDVAPPSNLPWFDGKIFEVRVWNVARTQAQIQADMRRRLVGNESGLVGYWRLDEGSGAQAQDATANANHGTITGATWTTAGTPWWVGVDVLDDGARVARAIVDEAILRDASIATAKIQDAAITSAKIGDLAVGTAHIDTAAITSAKIANAAVGSAAIANAAIGSAHIGNLVVQSQHVDTAAIVTAKIGDAAITGAKIANLAVQTAHVDTAAITSAKIGNLAVQTAHVDTAAITSAKIANLAVQTAHIDTAAITNAKINDLAADKITAGTLNVDRLAAGSIEAGKLSVKGVFLQGDTWTNNSPSAGSVAWNQHTLYYGGTAYTISASNTSNRYIYWVNGASSYTTSATYPSLGPTDFLIATNVDGAADFAWNRVAQEGIGDESILRRADVKIAVGLRKGIFSGVDGNVTISTNQTIPHPLMMYENLTINPGVILSTLGVGGPIGMQFIFVADTLTLHGTISGAGLGASRVTSPGRGGVHLMIVARKIVGTGTITVAGADGQASAGTTGSGAAGTLGGWTLGGGTYTGSSSAGTGGTQTPRGWRVMLAAPDVVGGNSTSGGQGGNGNPNGGQGGAGGGGGGALYVACLDDIPAITLNAYGGNGRAGSANDNFGGGGGGGGAGGAGGNGGAAATGDGGGGGGGGGAVLQLCRSTAATVNVAGGTGGAGFGSGAAGQNGAAGISKIILIP